MKFIYGKQDWHTRTRGQENCYLLTNGLGGFSSCSMISSNTRADHALLMACTEPPNHRYLMINRLEECLEWEGAFLHLSSQEYEDEKRSEEGYRCLSAFRFEDYPKWIYQAGGAEVTKEIAMKQGENLVAVKYTVDNQTDKDIIITITPYLQFTPKGTMPGPEQEFVLDEGRIASNGMTVFFHTNGTLRPFPLEFVQGMYYAYDACDGRMCTGTAYKNHSIAKKVPGNCRAVLEIVYGMTRIRESADEIIANAVSYRAQLARACGLKQDAAQMLAKSAGQFPAKRASTGGMTILAGFPFFEDWGRDTMIALAGCCISAGQPETAKSILRSFAAYCKDGLMPNLFPEGHNKPQYNTADAALLYIHAAYLYIRRTKDTAFLEEIWPVMEQIIRCCQKGTAHGIRMDQDGLLLAGEGLDQVTWMDVRIGDVLPTPRHGKPVEINAYWYNALCVMEAFAALLHKDGRSYGETAQRVKASFREKFWNQEKGCLYDVLSAVQKGAEHGSSAGGNEAAGSGKQAASGNGPSGPDGQIRCNQIWAVSMPFGMLEQEQEKRVVDVVFEKLYTPYGLRTLEKADSQFHGTYGGAQQQRDLAYHQGTVWVFPLGAYYLAYLKTRGYSKEAACRVKSQLEVLESAMREGCIGQLPEIYDGENPSFSRGCFAQAWSVGEILRVYELLENLPAAARIGSIQNKKQSE